MNQEINRNKLPIVEVVLAPLFYLISQYVGSPREEITHAGAEHFELLHQHLKCESKVLRDVGRVIQLQWRGLTNRTETDFDCDNVSPSLTLPFLKGCLYLTTRAD